MNNLTTAVNLTDAGLTIKSVDLVNIINSFRVEEGNRKELKHFTLTTKIKKELEMLVSLGLEGVKNFLESSYINSQNKKQPCYELNRDGMMQILMSESVYVRAKAIQYINKLENEVKQLSSDNKELHTIATSEEDQEQRQRKADIVKYAINNIEKVLLECDYTNIVATVDKIVEVHANLYVKERYKAHQDTDKYGFRGDNLYGNHVKDLIEKRLDKIRPNMTLKDTNINSIIITKARQLHKEVEASKNITTGKELADLKRRLAS